MSWKPERELVARLPSGVCFFNKICRLGPLRFNMLVQAYG